MNIQKFLNTNTGKVFIVFWIVNSLIVIARAGYSFGQWLYRLIN
jgi:hypothetical protein